MKLKIIETPDYLLAVSSENKPLDSEKTKNEYYLGSDDKIHRLNETFLLYFKDKIIGYQPKNNAPELDLPLLPEMVVEDDIDFTEIFYGILKATYPHFNEWVEAKEYNKRKAVDKAYSEEDLRKAIERARQIKYVTYSDDEIIQSLKQPKTPKWFVAEIEEVCRLMSADIVEKERWVKVENSKYTYQRLKTTTINGKTYLVGTYLYE
jgi:hypothetical protein